MMRFDLRADALPESIGPSPIKLRTPTSRKQILLVDDDTDVLVSVGGFLEAGNMDVIRACSGGEALSVLIAGDAVDAVVTDVVMRGMSGVEFIAAARRLRPALPALVITGYADMAKSGSLPDNVAVLLKPFRRKDFILRVQGLLDMSAAQTQRRYA